MSLFHSFHSLIHCYSIVFLVFNVIFSDAVIDKLKNIFKKNQHRIVVLSTAFRIAEFHGFPLHPQGLVTFAVKTLRFCFIFTQN